MREALLLVLPAIIHPVIIIRLLNHRLFGRSYKKKIRNFSTKKSHGIALPSDKTDSQLSKIQEQSVSKKGNLQESTVTSIESKEASIDMQTNKKFNQERLSITSDLPSLERRRPSFIYVETLKAEASGYNVICPWEGIVKKDSWQKDTLPKKTKILQRERSIDDSLLGLQNEKSIVETILEKNTKRFAKWRSSMKKKNKQSEDEAIMTEIDNKRKEDAITVEKELLVLQRELVNLPKISLDPSNVDSRSASPSLLLSRSNSLPNVNSESTPLGSFIVNNSQVIPSIVTNDPDIKESSPIFISEIIRDHSLPEIYISPSLPHDTNETDIPLNTLNKNSDSQQKDNETCPNDSDSSSKSITTLSTSNTSMHTDSENSKFSNIINRKKKKVSQSMKDKLISSKTPPSNQSTMSLPIEIKIQQFRNTSLSSNSSNERPRSLLILPRNIKLISLIRKSVEVPSLIKSEFDSMSIQRPTSPNFSLGNESSIPESNFCCSMKTCEVARNSGDIPNLQFSAMQLIDTWLHLSITDFTLIRDDVKEFLTRLSTQGSDQRLWCQNIWSFLKSQVSYYCFYYHNCKYFMVTKFFLSNIVLLI